MKIDIPEFLGNRSLCRYIRHHTEDNKGYKLMIFGGIIGACVLCGPESDLPDIMRIHLIPEGAKI